VNKAFTRETDDEDDDGPERDESLSTLPPGTRNYLTPGGYQRLVDERKHLLTVERPAVTAVVSWAAGNGDRSENADYTHGKRRLREIDRRLRFLTKRIENAEVIDPAAPRDQRSRERVFFGATVRYSTTLGEKHTVTIVGVDEIDLKAGHISWLSPLAKALMKSAVGDTVVLRAPGGDEELTVEEIRYEAVG
jgi:transcription elongation factor GreB